MDNGHLTEEKAKRDLTPVTKASIQGRAVGVEDNTFGYLSNVSILFHMSGLADDVDKWWSPQRDQRLREIWKDEPIMAGAVYSMVAKMKTMGYALDGPGRQVNRFQPIFANADFGQGWGNWMSKTAEDLLTQDKGAWSELIRANNDDPKSPVIGLAHLDASRCTPTGDLQYPVIYSNPRTGQYHRMADHQVLHFVSMPSPDETMRDIGFCAVSRALKATQIIRDVITYKREKLSGRQTRAIIYANGITLPQLEAALTKAKEDQDNKGYQRLGELAVTAGLDPAVDVDIKILELASLPDGYDEETTITLYVYILALAMGVDAREFWPATASGATKADALVQAQKAKGKGPGDIITTIERAMNWKVLPDSVTFRFDFQDDEEDRAKTDLETAKSQRITAMYYGQGAVPGVIDRNEARQMLADEKLIPEEFLQVDVTDEVTVDDVEQEKPEEKPKPEELPEEELPVEPVAPVEPTAQKATEEVELPFPEGTEEELAKREKALAKLVARLLTAQQKAVLAAVKKKSGAKAKDESEGVYDFEGDASDWVDEYEPILRDIAMYGAQQAAQALEGIAFSVDMALINEPVLKWAREYTYDLVKGLNDTTRQTLHTAMGDWMEGKLGKRGFPDLVKRLEATFGYERAERIASTEVTRAFSQGNLLIWKETDVTEKVWLTAADELVCPWCSQLNGKVVAVEKEFTATAKNGESQTVKEVTYKERMPPLHVQCRCKVVGLVKRTA